MAVTDWPDSTFPVSANKQLRRWSIVFRDCVVSYPLFEEPGMKRFPVFGVRALLCLGAFLVFLPRPAASQSTNAVELPGLSRAERRKLLQKRTWEVTAAPVTGELHIDGAVDDPAWAAAAPITDFYQRERNEGLPATEQTEVRVLYDNHNLYVSFRCFDRHPEKVKARSMFRDENGTADDLVSVMVDAFNDHRGAIQFITNSSGLVEDMLQTGETTDTRDQNFDTVWYSKGRRTPTGFEVEIQIPFKSLRFNSPGPGQEVIFGIGFKRNIPRKNEEVYWPFVGNDSSWYRPAELGHLRGLHDITPGRSIELRPYALAGFDQDGTLGTTHARKNAGLDLKWGMTPGLTADFTVNTDFAQEEADIQQVNFTRFDLFFPEKRQFFLEGERMFQFGVPQEDDLVFTRRIGLSDSGEAIPIRAGARVSGRQGPFTLGFMNIETGEQDSQPAENFTVFRVQRDFLSRSSVGALFTNRQGGGKYNRVYGTDLHLLFKRVWFLEGFIVRSDSPGVTGGNNSAYLRFAYDTDRWGAYYRHLDISENFQPGIGFVLRPDSRENFSEVRYSPRPDLSWVRQFSLDGYVRYITDHQNTLETRLRAGEFTTNLETGDIVTFRVVNDLESIQQPFALRSNVVIPPGTYQFNTFESYFETFKRRHFVIKLDFTTGGFWSGNRNTFMLDVDHRITQHLELAGTYTINWIALPQGQFTSHLLSSRLSWIFSNTVALFTLFQYDNDTNQFSSNIRFRWEIRPGSDFYIVYDETDDTTNPLKMTNRTLAVKLNYLFAF